MIAADSARTRLGELFAAIDASDTERFLSFLTAEASFRFGSTPVVFGAESIGEAVGGFFASIAGCRHSIARIVVEGDVVICEGEVTYTRHDQSQITLPFANVFEMAGDLISTYKIYVDAGPLYS
jgi:limonene-1,2-epoxide hydrolase